ncbi:MAG: ribosome maturation factor RimP [Oscillospiraceae bacterium]
MPKALKQPGGVAAKVEALVRPTIEGMGLRLWDVRFEKEGAEWVLRVLIDRDAPMDTDTCEAASRAIDPLLDEADPIDQGYLLEVGSPGLGRKLTRKEHFAAVAGQKVMARLFQPDAAGRREVAGTLLKLEDDTVWLGTEAGEVAVPVAAASAFKLCDDEGLFD